MCALVRDGSFAANLSGGVGGQVFARNRSGNYVRNRTIPITSTTSYALAQKARFAAASQAWQNLTAAQRAAWDDWAPQQTTTNRIGQNITLNGQPMFVGIHSRLSLVGVATLTVPPLASAPAPVSITSFSADIGAGTFDVVYTATPLPAATRLWIEGAVLNSAGINFVNNFLRFLGTSAAAQASPFDPQTLIEARFGTLLVGQKVTLFLRTFSTVTGLISQAVRTDATVVTTP